MSQKKLIKQLVCTIIFAAVSVQSYASEEKDSLHNDVLAMTEDLPDDVTRELKWTRLLNELAQNVENLKGQVVQHVADIKSHVSDQLAQHKAEMLAVMHSHSSNVGTCFSKLHDRFDAMEDVLEDLIGSATQSDSNFEDMGAHMGELTNLINQILQK